MKTVLPLQNQIPFLLGIVINNGQGFVCYIYLFLIITLIWRVKLFVSW